MSVAVLTFHQNNEYDTTATTIIEIAESLSQRISIRSQQALLIFGSNPFIGCNYVFVLR